MKINPQVVERLQRLSINEDAGLLVLLGYYYELDVDKACLEEAVKAVNLTGIVTREQGSRVLNWSMPLFVETVGEGVGEPIGDWAWVGRWMDGFRKINPERVGTYEDVLRRMQRFLSEYQFTVEDVFKARDLYFSSLTSPQYLMKSHKFIYEGVGKMQTCPILGYCRRVKEDEKGGTNEANPAGLGKIMIRK